MAMKKKIRASENRLLLKPELEFSYVKTQLEAAAGMEVPRELVNAVVKAGEPPKVNAVAKILLMIKESEGKNYADAISALGKGGRARFFVENSGGLLDIGYAARDSVGVFEEIIYGKRVPKLLEGNPKAVIEIARAAGVGAKGALGLLNHKEVAGAFIRNPKKIVEEFREISGICGRKSGMFFSIMQSGELRDTFAKKPEEAKKLAEAGADTWLFHALRMSKLIRKQAASGKIYARLNEFSRPRVGEYKNEWEKGREVARSAGLPLSDREVFINFAYAADKIGKKKTIAIHKEYGIEYFARYSKEELEGLYGHIGEKEDSRPLLIIAYNKFDDKGSFYEGLEKRRELVEAGHYNSIIFEAETEEGFYKKAKKFGEKYFGIADIIVGGHGNEGIIQLGPGEKDKYFLDFSDIKELGMLRKLFSEDSRVIFESCSVGKENAVGKAISDAFGAGMIAPQTNASLERYLLNGQGRISGVEYKKGKLLFEVWVKKGEMQGQK